MMKLSIKDQGDYIVREGDAVDGTYFIWDGEVSSLYFWWLVEFIYDLFNYYMIV